MGARPQQPDSSCSGSNRAAGDGNSQISSSAAARRKFTWRGIAKGIRESFIVASVAVVAAAAPAASDEPAAAATNASAATVAAATRAPPISRDKEVNPKTECVGKSMEASTCCSRKDTPPVIAVIVVVQAVSSFSIASSSAGIAAAVVALENVRTLSFPAAATVPLLGFATAVACLARVELLSMMLLMELLLGRLPWVHLLLRPEKAAQWAVAAPPAEL